MKQILVSSLLFCSLLAACATTKRPVRNSAPFPRENTESSDDRVLTDGVPPVSPEEPSNTPAPTPKPIATPVPTPQPKRRDAVYGVQEPGKPGFMRSPYHPEAGLIDYRSLPPGTEIKDPFTEGKTLLVP